MYVEYIIKRRSVNPYPTKEEKMNQPPVTKPSSKDTQTQFYIPKSAYYEMSRLQAHKDRQLVRKDIDKWVYESAGRTGIIWGLPAFGITSLLHLGIGPEKVLQKYKSVPIAYRFLLPVLVFTAAFFTRADHAAMEADRAFAMRYAINRDQFEQASINKKIQDAKPFDFTQEGIRTAFLRNKYSIVATIWVGTVAGTLFWNFKRKDISFSQKLINMRMTSQGAALIGLGNYMTDNLNDDHLCKHVSSLEDSGGHQHPFTDAHFDALIAKGKEDLEKK